MPPRRRGAPARASPADQANHPYACGKPVWVYARLLLTALAILFFAAMSAEVSKLSLTPVYGSIPPIASLNWLRGDSEHDPRWVAIVVFVAVTKILCSKHVLVKFCKHLTTLGFLTPSMQWGLYSFSRKLGPIWGPRSTHLLTSVPLSCLSLLCLLILITEAFPLAIFGVVAPTHSTKHVCGVILSTVLLTGTLYHFLTWIRLYLATRLPVFIMLKSGTHVMFSRFGLHTVTALAYALLGTLLKQSKLIFVGIVPFLQLVFLCPHVPLPYNTNVLNNTIRPQGFSLVARQESLTGYISVLDNINDGYRVMRCDHSLLGGEYIRKPKGSRYNEPVYTIFLTLEAVRLLRIDEPESEMSATSKEKNALVM